MSFKSNKREVVHKANKAVYKTLNQWAVNTQREIVDKLPEGERDGKYASTLGKLKDSVGVKFGTGRAYVGSTLYYARFIELGTSGSDGRQKIKPRHYFSSSAKNTAPKVKGTLQNNLRNA